MDPNKGKFKCKCKCNCDSKCKQKCLFPCKDQKACLNRDIEVVVTEIKELEKLNINNPMNEFKAKKLEKELEIKKNILKLYEADELQT